MYHQAAVIGKEVAELFSANGWHVVATMCNPEKGKELERLPNIVVVPLDVTDQKQIRETCRKALKRSSMFNNARYGESWLHWNRFSKRIYGICSIRM